MGHDYKALTQAHVSRYRRLTKPGGHDLIDAGGHLQQGKGAT